MKIVSTIMIEKQKTNPTILFNQLRTKYFQNISRNIKSVNGLKRIIKY